MNINERVQCDFTGYTSGKCKEEATEFYLSLVKISKGIIPRNRAVCKICELNILIYLNHKENKYKEKDLKKVDKEEWFSTENLGDVVDIIS